MWHPRTEEEKRGTYRTFHCGWTALKTAVSKARLWHFSKILPGPGLRGAAGMSVEGRKGRRWEGKEWGRGEGTWGIIRRNVRWLGGPTF